MKIPPPETSSTHVVALMQVALQQNEQTTIAESGKTVGRKTKRTTEAARKTPQAKTVVELAESYWP